MTRLQIVPQLNGESRRRCDLIAKGSQTKRVAQNPRLFF